MNDGPDATARRQELIAQLLRERGLDREGVLRVPRDEPLRASLAQERMWFWDRVTWPRSYLHNVPLSVRLRGPLDLAALGSAFEAFVARQESLRTSFLLEGPVVLQRIQDHVNVPLDVVDLSSRPNPWAEYEQLGLEEARRLFDITRTPLLRTTVVRLAEDDHVLLVTVHHIVWDGWSTGLLVYEIATHYRRALGLAEPLPDLPVLYADWAAWQHRTLAGDRLAHHADFWNNRLAGARTVHLTPAVRPPQSRVTDRGRMQRFSISPDLTRALATLAREEDATLFMVLLAGLTAVMHGLSGEDDVTVGALIANRATARIGGIIGYFVSTVPVRSRLPPDRSFVDHLRHIRAVALEAFAHQALPIGRIARGVANRRPEGWEQPLYSIDFMLQTAEWPEPPFGNVEMEIIEQNTLTADYDMGCIMWQRTTDLSKVEGLQCWWEYKTDLFDEGAIRALIRQFVATLELVVSAPFTPMADLPVLEDRQRDRAIVRVRRPGAGSPEDVVDAIRRHAHERGRAPALVGTDGTTWTYGSLNSEIGEAARRLAGVGVGPASIVAIRRATPQRDLITALAALSLGAAFRLGDDRCELDGVGFHLGRSKPSQEDGRRHSWAGMAQILLDTDAAGGEVEVLIPHWSLALGVETARNSLRLNPKDVVLHHATQLWETQVWLMLSPLAAGAELRPGPAESVPTRFELSGLFADDSITVVHTVPSRLRELLYACKEQRPSKLRAVVATGDRISAELVRRWWQELPGVELYSAYTPPGGAGPVMLHSVDPSTFVTAPWDTLGLPEPGHAAYLLDNRGVPVAPGATGHLFVAGDAIAAGYLGDPRRTAERFVPDPFSPHPGARMFAAGARARRRHDGLIERFDIAPGAVRVGGRFVRPDEVDAVLAGNPRIRRSVTLCMRGPDDGWHLVSYVVSAPPSPGSIDEALVRSWRELYEALPTPFGASGESWATSREVRVLELGNGTAVELNDLPYDHYDLIALNVVAHCFPGRARLERVLADAVQRVRTGGRVVFSGVRYRALRRAFFGARQLAAARPDASLSSARDEVDRAHRHDPELTVDPSFFVRAARDLPRVSSVLVQPCRGAPSSGESPFLFDVTMHIDHPDSPTTARIENAIWTHDASLAWLSGRLEERHPVLVLRGIPDDRVLEALAVERGLDETVPGATVEDLRRATTSSREAIDPDAVTSLALRHGYRAAIALDARSPGRFAATLWRRPDDAHAALMMSIKNAEVVDEPSTNAPAVVAHRWAVVRDVRHWLRGAVPAALQPSLILAVDHIPELPDGQPDVYQLPRPHQASGLSPCGSLERSLAEIWGDATESLGVGPHDRFVEHLGAHPVLAGALATALAQVGHEGVRTEDVLRAPTVAEIAAWIRTRGEGGDDAG
jgi:non-ribosomal peptide synthetase component F